MALFFAKHPNPFGWNPYQYFGLPAHDWYLPAVPYLSALWINLLPMLKPEHVYRLVVTTMACAVPVSMYLFIVYFTRRRGWALFAAVLYTLLSPSYFIFPAIQRDQGLTYLPWRMQVLVKYGEGPHNVGLALMPIALIACWHAATRRRFWHVFAAAGLLAIISLTNWVACLATGWCCLAMLIVGGATAQEHGFSARRLLGTASLGYLFAAFWLTPGFVRTTLFNWPADAFGYKVNAAQYGLFAAVLAITAVAWVLVLRKPRIHYAGMVTLIFAGFFLVVAGHYWHGTDTLPESRRYAVEAEFFFFVLLAEVVRVILFHPTRVYRDIMMVALGAAAYWILPQAVNYATRGWMLLRPHPRQQTIEYRVSELIASRQPRARVFVTGGTRFRFNSWYLIPQLGGTFESGLRNRSALLFFYCIRTGLGSAPGRRGIDTILHMRAAGIEYAAIHGPRSDEHWRDIQEPTQFEGRLEKVWQEGDNHVYKLPFHGLAHLVRESEYPQGFAMNVNAPILEPFVAAMDAPERRLDFEWLGTSRFRIRGAVPEEMLISARVAHDPGWTATQDGTPLRVEPDALGLILLRPRAASNSAIEVVYKPPVEQIAMTVVSALAWVGAVAFVRRERRRRHA